jgi:ribosome-associated toxin RatA of RatAB toxin-antitoxin module
MGCMPIITHTLPIRAPAGPLFALAQDYRRRRLWDPFVRDMRFPDGDAAPGVGVRVWVRAWNGLTMEVRFTAFQPPRMVAMKMVRGPWMFRQFAGTWRFEPRGEGDTDVTFRYFFRLRPGLRLLESLVAAVLRRDVRARLRGLRQGFATVDGEGLANRVGHAPLTAD